MCSLSSTEFDCGVVESVQIERQFTNKQLELLPYDENGGETSDDSDGEGGIHISADARLGVSKDRILRNIVAKDGIRRPGDRFFDLRQNLIRAVNQDESLIQDKEDEKLSEQEMNEAMEAYEREKETGISVIRPRMPINNSGGGTAEQATVTCPRQGCGQLLTVPKTVQKFGCPKCRGIFSAISMHYLGDLDANSGAPAPRAGPTPTVAPPMLDANGKPISTPVRQETQQQQQHQQQQYHQQQQQQYQQQQQQHQQQQYQQQQQQYRQQQYQQQQQQYQNQQYAGDYQQYNAQPIQVYCAYADCEQIQQVTDESQRFYCYGCRRESFFMCCTCSNRRTMREDDHNYNCPNCGAMQSPPPELQ